MYGVSFGGKHSYSDYGLYLAPKSIPLPEAKKLSVNIWGADGEEDISTALTDGRVKYKNRKFSITLIAKGTARESLRRYFCDAVHGRQFDSIIFDSDPDRYYVGRADVTGYKDLIAYSEITVYLDLKPYAYDIELTVCSWAVDSIAQVTVPCGRMAAVPNITVDAAMTVAFKNVVYSLTEGSNEIIDILLEEGDNNLLFTGTGNVTVSYRGGGL